MAGRARRPAGGATRTRRRAPATRCGWTAGDPLLERYHDVEWGVPVRTARAHFERLSLEVFQAGLSWRVILHKRAAFRRAFAGFDPRRVARFGRRDVARLLADPDIVRNRMKCEATIENARRFLEVTKRCGGIAAWLRALGADQEEMTRALRRDFLFMGPLVAESYLQSVGLVPAPHAPGCFRRRAVGRR